MHYLTKRVGSIAMLTMLLCVPMSCNGDGAPAGRPTTKVRYERTGGGQLAFVVTESPTGYAVHVARAQYRNVSVELAIEKDALDAGAASALDALFEGTVDIGGTSASSSMPTGTWESAYIDDNGTWLRVTNTAVLGKLRPLEQAVRSALPSGVN